MKKYIVTVCVEDNRKFGIGKSKLEILVLGKGNPLEKVTNYLNNSSFQYFKIVKMQLVEKDVCLENIYEILDWWGDWMKIMLVCPDCNNTSFVIKQEMGFFKKKTKSIDNENYYTQEVVCTKCKSVHFIGGLPIGIVSEKGDN